MKKADEIEFYRLLRERAANSDSGRYFGPCADVLAICAAIGMHPKRAFYLLIKWSECGYIDYGVWAWAGWFENDAPLELAAY